MKISRKQLYIVLISPLLIAAIAALVIIGRRHLNQSHVMQGQRIEGGEIRSDDFDKPWPSILKYDFIPAPYKSEVKRTTILNTLVEKYGYRSYLEIGQGHKEDNLQWIDCPIKIGVDPNTNLDATFQMTSDDFFAQNKDSFDLIFVDGLHHADQAEKDILNSLKFLNKNGTIVAHDCNPKDESWQTIPSSVPTWTGDVWKAWVKLRATRPDLKMYVIDIDFGCGIIRKGTQETIHIPEELTYRLLVENREEYLNLVDINFFLQDIRVN